MKQKTIQDYKLLFINKIFGKLTVVDILPDRINSRIFCKCKCTCGNLCNIRLDHLKRSTTQSCGCLMTYSVLDDQLPKLIGSKWGRFIILEFVKKKDRKFRCTARCECGNVREVFFDELKCGRTKSCGCLRNEIAKMVNTTHNMTKTKVYKTWGRMVERCKTNRPHSYKYYKSRGISVCKRWQESFEDFYSDMGDPPSVNHSIDRIDNNKGYCPENCRWATIYEQSHNRSSNIHINIDGAQYCLTEACKIKGLSRIQVDWRKKRDQCSHQEAFITALKECILKN